MATDCLTQRDAAPSPDLATRRPVDVLTHKLFEFSLIDGTRRTAKFLLWIVTATDTATQARANPMKDIAAARGKLDRASDCRNHGPADKHANPLNVLPLLAFEVGERCVRDTCAEVSRIKVFGLRRCSIEAKRLAALRHYPSWVAANGNVSLLIPAIGDH